MFAKIGEKIVVLIRAGVEHRNKLRAHNSRPPLQRSPTLILSPLRVSPSPSLKDRNRLSGKGPVKKLR